MTRQMTQSVIAKCKGCEMDFTKIAWNHLLCNNCKLIRDTASHKKSQLRITARTKINQRVCEHCFCLFKIQNGRNERKYCTQKCSRRAQRIKHLHKRIIEIQAQIQKLTATGGYE